MTDTFKRGDMIRFRGVDSSFEGQFLCYIDKLEWRSIHNGQYHGPVHRCLVQQNGTGMIFVKPEPTEDNRL